MTRLLPGAALSLHALALAAILATAGCSMFSDSQVESLDLAALEAGDGYVVGTVTTCAKHDDGKQVVLTERPDVSYDLNFNAAPDAPSFVDSLPFNSTPGRVAVQGAAGPALFALQRPAGRNQLVSLSIQVGNGEWIAPLPYGFDVEPGAVTYIGNLWLQIDSEEGLFGLDVRTGVDSAISDDRALLDQLMRQRFPNARPELRVALAQPRGT